MNQIAGKTWLPWGNFIGEAREPMDSFKEFIIYFESLENLSDLPLIFLVFSV